MPPRSDFDNGLFSAVDDAHAYHTPSSSPTLSLAKCLSRSAPVKKQVSFAPMVQVNPVLHIDDFMVSEVANSWYSKSELNQIREGCRRTISAMNKGQDTYDSSRGLEERTVEGNQRKLQCRITAWDAVMDEVESQILHYGAVVNPKRVAHVYKMATIECTLRAQETGVHDAEETKRNIRD